MTSAVLPHRAFQKCERRWFVNHVPEYSVGTVATAMRVELRDAKIIAEGDLDFRGTLGVSKDVPVGFKNIRLRFELDTIAAEDQVATLIRLTERYCVVLQTLRTPPAISIERKCE